MLRPVSLLLALVAAAAATALPLAPAPAQAHPQARRAAATPLAVTIDDLTPSEIPESGPIRVQGTVTNQDTETWTTVNLYAFLSDAPMTTRSELARAARTPADSPVGERIVEESAPQTQDTIDLLAPGATATYSITIPHRYVDVTEAGVYWFGVHALGQGPDGRDDTADGRARTFLPFVPPARKNQVQPTIQTSLVIPIRRQITHAPDGTVSDVDSWVDTLGSGGALRSLVDVGVAAGSRAVTWLVDPAVPDTVRDLVAGNPARSLGPTVGEDGAGDGDQGGGEDGGSESPSPEESAAPSEDAGQDGEVSELTPELQAAADEGSSWLEALHQGLEGHEILSLPYGDVDVAAAAKYDPAGYRAARKRATGDLQPWGLPTTPVASSPSGFIDTAGLRLVEPATTVLVTDRMLEGRAPAVVRTEGRTLAVSSSAAASGGPGPTDRTSPLAVRQRILCEAAVRLLAPGREPLIVTLPVHLPASWSAADTTAGSLTDFFTGLDVDWIDLTSLSTLTQRTPTDVDVDRLHYPDTQRRLELDADVFTAAGDLVQAGETLQNLLTRNDQVASVIRDEAFSDTSYSSRLRPMLAESSADQSRAWIDKHLRGVSIDAPRSVILSSGSGRFSATITNDLDEPVSVKVEAVADRPLKVRVPEETIDIAAQSRTTVLFNASSSAGGVRNVTLQLTDVDGVPLGASDDLPIRSNQVSDVIWLILGTGVALLFGTIAVRLVRRIRAARS